MRTLGMALAFAAVAVVLRQVISETAVWLLAPLCFVWPHIAALASYRSRNPVAAEFRNFLVDAAIAGIVIALMRFNLLPSALIVTMLVSGSIMAGGWPMLARSVPAAFAGCAVTALATGWSVRFASGMNEILACLPMLVVYPVVLATTMFELMRSTRELNRKLEAVTRTDSLTGLPSRCHWESVADTELQRYCERGQPAALMILDIDRFKSFNDQHGHPAGDLLIRRMAGVIRQHTRAGDTPGRYGGDEFVVVLPCTGITEAAQVADRIRESAERVLSHGGSATGTVSIGVCPASADLRDVDEWLKCADRSLYDAKQRGRNRVVVSGGPDVVSRNAGAGVVAFEAGPFRAANSTRSTPTVGVAPGS
ncbi:MAG: diguanylate cyclase [Lysobacterales bacterium]